MPRSPNKTASNPDLPSASDSQDLCITMRKRKQPDCDCSAAVCASHSSATRDFAKVLKEFRRELDDKLTKVNENIVNTIRADLDILRETSTDIKNEINALRLEHSTFKQQILNMEHSLQFQSEQHDDLQKRVDLIDNRTSSFDAVGEKLSNLELKMESMEQHARLTNIEICNVPEKRDEDLLTIVESIGAAIKCPISRRDALAIHRVPPARSQDSGRPKNIIVKFSSRVLRNNVLSAYRLHKSLKTDSIGISGTSQNIYLNEHLTLYNKNLFRECRDKAKKHNFKFVWIKNATVLVKESDNSKTLVVRCQNDINKIFHCKNP